MTGENLREKLELAAPEPEVEPRRSWRDEFAHPGPLAIFAGVLAIGSGASIAVGGDIRVAVGLWAVLCVTFWVGMKAGQEERDAAQG